MSIVNVGDLSVISPNDVVTNESFVHLDEEAKEQIKKELSLTDNQLNAWLVMDDANQPLSTINFSEANKDILHIFGQSDHLSSLAQEFVSARAPVALASEASNPDNWQSGEYTGSGAMWISAFVQPNSERLPIENLEPPIDINTVSIDALVMSVLTQRAEIIEVQLRDQIASIQQKNAELEVANVWLTRAKEQKANADSGGSEGKSTFGQEFIDYWNSLGAEYQTSDRETGSPGLQHKSADWDVNIEGLKAKVEALTSQSQLETTKLQQTINKYNQSFEMLSNFINKYYQSINTVIQNLR